MIVVRLHAGGGAQATFTVRSQCEPERQETPDTPDKPNKPDKPDKPNEPDRPQEYSKPKKRKKSFYDPGVDAPRSGEARSILSHGEV